MDATCRCAIAVSSDPASAPAVASTLCTAAGPPPDRSHWMTLPSSPALISMGPGQLLSLLPQPLLLPCRPPLLLPQPPPLLPRISPMLLRSPLLLPLLQALSGGGWVSHDCPVMPNRVGCWLHLLLVLSVLVRERAVGCGGNSGSGTCSNAGALQEPLSGYSCGSTDYTTATAVLKGEGVQTGLRRFARMML